VLLSIETTKKRENYAYHYDTNITSIQSEFSDPRGIAISSHFLASDRHPCLALLPYCPNTVVHINITDIYTQFFSGFVEQELPPLVVTRSLTPRN